MRTALCLALTLLAARADAALLPFTEPPDPENYTRIDGEYDVSGITYLQFYAMSLSDPLGPGMNAPGWQEVPAFNANMPGIKPPDWKMQPFWVPESEGGFYLRPVTAPPWVFIEVDLAEFIGAGDAALGLTLPYDSVDVWNVIPIASPNLGSVVREFEIQGDDVPEPATEAVAAVALFGLLWWRGRR